MKYLPTRLSTLKGQCNDFNVKSAACTIYIVYLDRSVRKRAAFPRNTDILLRPRNTDMLLSNRKKKIISSDLQFRVAVIETTV